MAQWEYHIHANQKEEHLDEVLSDLGEKGWELVAVTPETKASFEIYIFKRPY
jgi:acetolactate synthase regulatory subunit